MNTKLQQIHSTAIRILEEIGIKLEHPEVVDIIRQKGVKVSGKTAFFTQNQVMEWIGKAPEKFTLYARNSRYNTVIGGDHVECAPGYGCPTIINVDGTRREALLDDYITFAKLVHQSDCFKINGGILVQPSDVDASKSHLIMLYAALTCSDKCIMGIPGAGQNIQEVIDMMSILFGGKDAFMEKPRVLTMISPISPLRIDEMGLNSILVAARYHQPLSMSPAPAAGTTGPINLAGNLAMGTAEALAAIAIAQMIEEGTPVIFGLHACGADLKSGNVSIGSPAYALQTKCCAQLARMYGLPSRGGGASTDAKGISVQSGYESMLSLLTAFQHRINLIIQSAGILDSFAGMSYEQFLVDLEIIGMIRFYLKDLETDDEALSFEIIKEVGPGGTFLTTMDTLKKCRSHSWDPEISFRGRLTGQTPTEKILENIRKKQQKMLDNYCKPDLDTGIQKKLDDYLLQVGVSQKVINTIQRA